jgi:signal transduction histidine kinase
MFQALKSNPHCQVLSQPNNQAEYWQRSLSMVESLLPEYPNGILLSHSPHLNYSHGLVDQLWIFTSSNSCLINLADDLAGWECSLEVVYVPEVDAFLLYLTSDFQILLVATEQDFLFSCHHQPLIQAIALLDKFVDRPEQRLKWNFLPQANADYNSLARITKALLLHNPSEMPIPEITEVDILRSLSHEVNTPLTTISTLVKSLLRHQNLGEKVRQRLEQIDLECRNQIDRFRLIFEALDLGRSPLLMSVIETEKLFQELLPYWREKTRNQKLSLDLFLPYILPTISSNSQLLKLLLNGIIDRLSRVLPIDSQIQIETAIVGEYWKLQFHVTVENQLPLVQTLGQWLTLQPETGRVNLSLSITKTLFRSLRGKLTVKQPLANASEGEILTIFLPLQMK